MKVNEHFAPTIQGEGALVGQRCGFIRLANCNLSCSWCDTPYSWDWKRYDKKVEAVETSIEELVEVINGWVEEYNLWHVVISGGEPLLQQQDIIKLIKATDKIIDFHIETNGTIKPLPELAQLAYFTVSPKLGHAGDPLKKRIKKDALQVFAALTHLDKAKFKFVAQQPTDLHTVAELAIEYGIDQNDIWIMPEGATRSTQLSSLNAIADAVVDAGFNLSPRLHVMAWNDRRGV